MMTLPLEGCTLADCVPGTKLRSNFRALERTECRERMLLGSFVPGNESVWERNVPVPTHFIAD